jgi:thioredoxin-related protein
MILAPKITRRYINKLALTGAGLMAAGPTAWAAAGKYAPVVGENGHVTQSWFLESFLEFSDDVAEAQSRGKRFAIIWEQEGCPYCRETHMVNFAIPEIRDYIEANFEIVQLDIWGARQAVDFNGNQTTEKKLAKQSQIRFTPTVQFFPESADMVKGKSGKDAEVARMPGYFRPFHFLTMFEYVRDKGYEKGAFPSYLKQKMADYKIQGKALPNW